MDKPHSILKTLLYFDIFDYPLNVAEIRKFSNITVGSADLEENLSLLSEKGKIFSDGQYFGLNEDDSQFKKRNVLNKRADDIMPKAYQNGHLIMKFPFVRYVYISGSLSKGVYAEDDDIDYFIISDQNRIWISKLFLKLYKFFVLGDSYEEFCINYFKSLDHLEIKDKNLFTATELVTLIPIMECSGFDSIYSANLWALDLLPNFSMPSYKKELILKKPIWSRIVEFVFSGPIGNACNKIILNLNNRRTKRKYKEKAKEKDYELMFRSTENESKQHPQNSQSRVLETLDKKLVEYIS